MALLREIRSHATLVALHGMAMVLRSSHAVDASQLFFTHVASLRPLKVGAHKKDTHNDALVPAICRAFTRSPRP